IEGYLVPVFHRQSYMLISNLSVDLDSSFAWGHYVLSDFHNTHRINRQVADKHIALAMKYREELPLNQNIQIRLLNYRMKDQQKESLTLADFLHKSRPTDANLLLNLIHEYFQQAKYEAVIKEIGEYRVLKGAPNALLDLLTQSLIRLDRVDEAIRQLKLVLNRNSMNEDALLWLGKAHLANQDYEKAQEIFEQLSVLNPNQEEVENLRSHVLFIQDSVEIFEGDFYESLTGTYWAAGISKRSSHEIFLENGRLYFQFEGSETSELMYPLSKTVYFSVNNQNDLNTQSRHYFITNDEGVYDRMLIDESGDLSGYMNFEIDEGILKGMDGFDTGDYEAAETQFRTSLQEHPNHDFLPLYLDHLAFRKDTVYAKLPVDWQAYEGIYFTQTHQYKIFLENEELYIQSESNLSYNDPILLLALDKNTFLDSHKLTYEIQFTEEGKDITLEFINGPNQSVIAKRLR
ncbi:MAG: tetratricopeptide repeat protein, partial [Bacteroidota bacterium]